MQALHWLARNNIPLYVMNYDGAIISQVLPSISVKADLRIAQIDASRDHVTHTRNYYLTVQFTMAAPRDTHEGYERGNSNGPLGRKLLTPPPPETACNTQR